MASAPIQLDWYVTKDKILHAVHRIVEVCDPIRVTAFGSRARGDFRPDSDLDLAVMVEHWDAKTKPRVLGRSQLDVYMPVDLLVFDRKRHEDFKPWLASVHHDIENEGVVLYDRATGQLADERTFGRLVG